MEDESRQNNIRKLLKENWDLIADKNAWIQNIKKNEAGSIIRDIFSGKIEEPEECFGKTIKILLSLEPKETGKSSGQGSFREMKNYLNGILFKIPEDSNPVSYVNIKEKSTDGLNAFEIYLNDLEVRTEDKETKLELSLGQKLELKVRMAEEENNECALNLDKVIEENFKEFTKEYIEYSFALTGNDYKVKLRLRIFLNYRDRVFVIRKMIDDINTFIARDCRNNSLFNELLEILNLNYDKKNRSFKSKFEEMGLLRGKCCGECLVS